MSTSAIQPDLIISLSRDRVRLNISEDAESGRPAWQTSFDVDHIFLQEQISMSLDKALLENPSLFDQFPCVEIVVLDRPNICVSRKFLENGKLGEIASRHLRLRAGDTLTTDLSALDTVFCYSLPTETLQMLKEYYSNINCNHLSSIIWHALVSKEPMTRQDTTRLYFTLAGDTLVLLAERNKKLIFSKNFTIRDKGDFLYYSIACSRMLKANEHWFVTTQDEGVKYDIPPDHFLKINKQLSLPSLRVLMAQYNVCES